jgi:cytochrome c-type biogenesis protein CcmH
MTLFVVLAAVLAIGTALPVVWPLVRRGRAGEPARSAAVAAFLVVAGGAAALYAAWSNFSWSTPSVDTPQAMVARLARRLERDPDDLKGWLMLGRSYIVLEQYPLALRAYQRADQLAGSKDPEALTGMGEALALLDSDGLAGRAGEYCEAALRLDPQSGKALFFGAAAAMRRNELPLARERFARLLALGPPENVRPILEQQIALLDRRIADGESAAGTAASAPATVASTAPATARAEAAPGGPAVRVDVDIAPALRRELDAASPLFVIVRDPAAPGPPIAVKRLPARFPQSVELTAADAMVPGRVFESGQSVQVVARIARSGSVRATAGDPFGEVRYDVGREGSASVLIDRLTP